MRHHGTDDDSDQHTGKNEEHAKIPDVREEAVHEEHNAAAHPGADDEADERVPGVRHEGRMHERVHGDGLLTQDGRHGGSTQDPRKTVPESSKETADTAMLSSGDRSPVVD